MLISPDHALEALLAELQRPAPSLPLVPERDLTRTPAARRVARMAGDAGLFLFHYEHRSTGDLPEDWVPAQQPELALAPEWAAGVLPEPKYQSFRHDLPIGGFNPGHRAKWTTHELCHGLVGFGWWPAQSPLALATASRLAELLPVALWYFFDEALLLRCDDHRGGGALFRTFCAECERVAAPWTDDLHARQRLADGLRFVDRELAAIARTRREGRPVPNLWATIDLCSDGMAYADGHGRRLRSEAFAYFARRFAVAGGGMAPDLDALEARVLDVLHGVFGLREPAPLAPTPEAGRARWMLQDVGWRLLTVWHETEGESADALLAMIEHLADGIPATRSGQGLDAEARLSQVLADYQELVEEWVLPPADHVFGVGYPLVDGWGSAWEQLGEGIDSAVPNASRLLEPDTAHRFAEHDAWTREPLPTRFARWAVDEEPELSDLIAFETAVATVRPGPDAPRILAGSGEVELALIDGAHIVRTSRDPVAFADAVEAGDVYREGDGIGGLDEVPEGDAAVLIAKPGKDLLVLDLDPAAADALLAGDIDAVEPEVAASLAQLGVLVPTRWRV
ncbi:MAG: hypothetical protein EP330_28605 [Deltaproteobacteria bacterium]|nr:MAG: hypothetical protein EP330_28605 [Deltaproteobacteria bacterium]